MKCGISVFRRGVNEIFTLLGFYAARDRSFLDRLALEDGTDKLSINVGNH
jgi:hypothetical protein